LIWKPFFQQSLKSRTLSIHVVSFAVTEMNHPEYPEQGRITVQDRTKYNQIVLASAVHNTLVHINEDRVLLLSFDYGTGENCT
jgi:hypothetical protein